MYKDMLAFAMSQEYNAIKIFKMLTTYLAWKFFYSVIFIYTSYSWISKILLFNWICSDKTTSIFRFFEVIFFCKI